ncbi:Asp-tRNA(Asn)/Glu-tRNA(Gln) amidotransferase subunit GatA [Acidobacteria bacterium AH-259-D05]|nr:Asp-tRNA(Asn)/Glu-tRNA(Gln) amidotransferase subunit GatA [Acidobacteria bacterium AH-259-D05]
MSHIYQLSIQELRQAIARKESSVTEVVRSFLDRIDQQEERIQSFLTVDPESALAQAQELDEKLAAGELQNGLLTGIPLAIKDNIVTEGVRTTCASRILQNYLPPYDATVVGKLKENGVIVLGKTNCDEFAMGSSTENSAYFPTRNPWDLERVPGGSSGGSAAAVAAWEAPGALGSDTGGSIRQPAAFCGVVGLKPTYGRVSRYGLVAFASSLDQIGPLANNVSDVAILLQAIAGPDPRDSTSLERPVEDYLGELGKEVKGLKIGVPQEWFSSGLDPQIEQATQGAIKKLEGLGCPVTQVHMPHTEYAISAYYIIAPAEASSNLARYDGVKYGYRSPHPKDLESMFKSARSEGFGEEVKRRIMIGTYALSAGYYDAYFLKASKVRTLLKKDYLEAFKEVDFLVGPTTPSLPFKMGEKKTDPLEMYLMDVYTVTANLAGIPGIGMPCGFSQEGLPIGLQIQAPHFQEAKLLRLAYALEKELSLERPTLATDR